MATRTAAQPIAWMSEEEFLSRIWEKPSLEYTDGAVYRKPVAGKKHGRLAGLLSRRLSEYGDTHGGWGGPEIHVRFSEEFHRIYKVPDVSWWAPDKPDSDDDIGSPPTLAVEVRSPGQSMDELREKCKFMQASGADTCWLVDPDARTIEVFEDGDPVTLDEGEVLMSPVLPGFSLSVADLFAVIA